MRVSFLANNISKCQLIILLDRKQEFGPSQRLYQDVKTNSSNLKKQTTTITSNPETEMKRPQFLMWPQDRSIELASCNSNEPDPHPRQINAAIKTLLQLSVIIHNCDLVLSTCHLPRTHLHLRTYSSSFATSMYFFFYGHMLVFC